MISIIIPCFNVEKYLKRCIDSIMNQTYKNFEILLINDGSTDNTEEACLKCTNENKNVRYFKKENGGVSSARNLGLDNARGEYIAFIDADDTIEPDYFQLLLNEFKEEYAFTTFSGICKVINGNKVENPIKPCFISLLKSPTVCSRLYSKKFLDSMNLRFENSSIGEDLEFSAKILIHGGKYSIVDGLLYNYHMNDTSLTHTFTRHVFSIIDAVERIEEFARKEQKYDEFYSTLEFVNICHILMQLLRNAYKVPDFSIKDIDEIVSYVSNKYPKWNENKNICELKEIDQVYLKDLFNKNYEEIINYLKR